MADEMMLMLNDDGVAHIYDETYDIVIHCESAEEQKKVEKRLMEMSWVPCSERLPVAEYGESDNVLATCALRNADDTSCRWVKTLYFNGGVWCYPTGEQYEQKVIAWMPLPEPWEGMP